VNGNIKRLAKEANLLERPAITWSCAPVEVNFFTNAMIEKFAELIIKQCCEAADGSVYFNKITGAWSWPVTRIKEHFGIKP
jgi:hypothetical protein